MGTYGIDWTGIWETNYGEVELPQTNNTVSGVYVLKQGRINGRALMTSWLANGQRPLPMPHQMMQGSSKYKRTNQADRLRASGGSSDLQRNTNGLAGKYRSPQYLISLN